MPMHESVFHLASMIPGLGGGLALFLYGMRKMTEALKTVAGAGLKDFLARLTTNRFTGALSGALITDVVQSSSVTTLDAAQREDAGNEPEGLAVCAQKPDNGLAMNENSLCWALAAPRAASVLARGPHPRVARTAYNSDGWG